MKTILRTFLVLSVLLAYGVQVAAAEQHVHGAHERTHCAVCVFGSLPGEPATTTAEALPPDAFGTSEAWVGAHVAPPPALTPLDVSFSTSPPTA